MSTKKKNPWWWVSQSLLKSLMAHYEGDLCGKLLERRHVHNIYDPPSDSMKLGHYFEFRATGALPKDGIKPEPEMTKTTGFTMAYKRAEAQADNFKNLCEVMGVKILKKGHTVKNTAGLIGDLDIVAHVKSPGKFKYWGENEDKNIVIDLKFSGTYDNRWEDYGFNAESLPYKRPMRVQSVHYHRLTGLPFYFWVFDAKSFDANKIFEITFNENGITNHEIEVATARKNMNTFLDLGFSTIPDFDVCKDCPLRSKCPDRAEAPIPKPIEFQER